MRDAEQGHARAQRLLALRYLRGRGVAQDLAAAHRWLQAAARQGLALAQRDLGTCYEQGLGVARDVREARRLYLLAAAQGDPIAERCLQELATAVARTPYHQDTVPPSAIVVPWRRLFIGDAQSSSSRSSSSSS